MGMVDFIYNAMNNNQNQQNMGMQLDPMMDGMVDPSLSYDTSIDYDAMPMADPAYYNGDAELAVMQQQQMLMQQQMLQQAQIHPPMSPYGMQAYGYKPVHYSKYEIIEGLKNYIMNTTGIMVSRVVKFDDYPQIVKHACMQGKIQKLMPNTFTVPEAGVSFQYWFCMYCGKLFLLKDSI